MASDRINQYPAFPLGNVQDSFTFDVTPVHIITDKDRTLKMIVNTNTDASWAMVTISTLQNHNRNSLVGSYFRVKARSSQKVTVKVNTAKFAEELLKQMPNGYFLEGFVRLSIQRIRRCGTCRLWAS